MDGEAKVSCDLQANETTKQVRQSDRDVITDSFLFFFSLGTAYESFSARKKRKQRKWATSQPQRKGWKSSDKG